MPATIENKINSVTSSVDTGTSIKFIGESDSTGNNLRIEDGKLSGTIVGAVIKDYTGRVDDVTLELSNVPIDGVGGGSSLEWVKVIDTAYLDTTLSNTVVRCAGGGNFGGKTLYDLIQDREIIAVRGITKGLKNGAVFASYSGSLIIQTGTSTIVPIDAMVAGSDIRNGALGAAAYFLFTDYVVSHLTDQSSVEVEVWVLVA